MNQYQEMLKHILSEGNIRGDRTGTGTISVFGYQMRFDLGKGFPLATTKKVWFKGVKAELLWFLSANTNIKPLVDQDVHIWDAWADDDGNLGPVYGEQWRRWAGAGISLTHDQIADVIESIRTNPESRRHIVSAWNVGELDKMALPPCHLLFQFYVHDGKLSCHLYQRSADAFLGVPFNIASYSLLTHMIAQCCELEPGEFIHSFGDLHIYQNHLDQVYTQLNREPRKLPTLYLAHHIKDIDKFTASDIWVDEYNPHPAIKAEVAV